MSALYIVSRPARNVVRYSEPLRKPGIDKVLRGFIVPNAAAVDPAGRLYVTDGDGNRVLVYENP